MRPGGVVWLHCIAPKLRTIPVASRCTYGSMPGSNTTMLPVVLVLERDVLLQEIA